jgi:hypothetical protein
MRIVDTLHSFENSSAALVEVAAEEIADFDEMMMLVDGKGGDYSIDARLVSTTTPPKVEMFGIVSRCDSGNSPNPQISGVSTDTTR